MPNQAGTLESLGLTLGRALSPLTHEWKPDQVLAFLAGLGMQFPAALLNPGGFTSALEDGVEAAEDLLQGLSEMGAAIDSGDAGQILQKGVALLQGVVAVVTSVEGIRDGLASAAPGLPGMNAAEVTAFANALPGKVVEQLLIRYLENRVPSVAGALLLAGLIERDANPGVPGDASKPPYLERKLRLERLGTLLSAPLQLFEEVYGWDTGSVDAPLLAKRFQQFLKLQNLPTVLKLPPESPQPTVESWVGTLEANAAGFMVTLHPAVAGGLDFTLPLSPTWSLHLTTTGQLEAEALITVEPPAQVVVTSAGGSLNAEFKAELTALPQAPAKALVLLGQTGSSRLETASMSFALGFALEDQGGGQAQGEPIIQAVIDGGKVVIDSSGGGLLAKLLSSLRIEGGFDLRADWRPSTGLQLEGGAGIEIRIPVSFTLGPVEIQSLYLRLALGSGGTITIELSSGLRLTLGPLTVSVDRMGVQGLLEFPSGGGNLGPVDLDIGFKPPNGLGLAVDAGPISGGGFLDFQPGPPERYAGALSLNLISFSVHAYGLFERTKAGSISFVVVLGARFTPGFQVGFGIAITGVGGLVGINRRADVDLLRERLSSGTAGNVLFTENPVQSAPSLLGDLAQLFPAAEGVFIVGPTLQISWLTLVRFDLGLLIELPGPTKIILLGIGRIDLGGQAGTPALVQIRLDMLGVIDFVQELVSFDAALVNSRLMQIFHLTGSSGFRLSTGDRPYSILTVGGFHPAFNPEPAQFPPLARVGMTFDSGGLGLSLRLESYLAITSNTFQLGAAVQVKVEAGPLNALGYLTFDALIQFRPFYFDIRFTAGLQVRWDSYSLADVRCEGTLTGPGPLVLAASFSVEILFFDVSWSDTFTLGEDAGEKVTPVASLVQALAGELAKPANLEATGGQDTLVATSAKTATGKALISPRGQLAWSQKRAPLDLVLERFEGVPLSKPQAVIATVPMASEAVQDWFSPGTFIQLSQSESINRGAFERLEAGLRVGFGLTKSGTVAHPLEVKTIRLPQELLLLKLFLPFPSRLLESVAGRRAPASVFSAAPAITVQDETWAVQAKDGGGLVGGISQSDAHQRARYAGAVALPKLDAEEPINLGGI